MTKYELSDFRQTKNYACFMQVNNWLLQQAGRGLGRTNIFIWKIRNTPYSIIRVCRAGNLSFLDYLGVLEKKYNAISIRIEPKMVDSEKEKYEKLLIDRGFKKSDRIHTPTKTKIIILKNLRSLEENLSSKLKYNIRLASKKGVEITRRNGKQIAKGKDLFQAFYKILEKDQRRLKIPILPKKWIEDILRTFGGNAVLFTAMWQKTPVAIALFLTTNNAMYYVLSANTKEGRVVSAQHINVWEGIKLAQKLKLKYFDFDGIYDERFHKMTESWKGFTRFKESYGGETITLMPPYEKIKKDLNWRQDFLVKMFTPQYLPSIYPEQPF